MSDDLDVVAQATSAVHDRFGNHVSAARSQPNYLDVTYPEANKGAVARYLSARYGTLPEAIATVGDAANDVLMFGHSGLSIAMGNASVEVQRGPAGHGFQRGRGLRQRGREVHPPPFI